jgi:hypothetical protein
VRRSRGSLAPRILDPILGLVERIDRRLRRIHPIGDDSVLGLERHRHGGAPVTLGDGTVVRVGALAPIIHFDNRRLQQLASSGWPTDAWRVARSDLRSLAAAHAALPPEERPMAYHGTTLLAALTRRAGFEVRERRRTPWVRLQDWYLRSLLARWAPDGRVRLTHGHGPLQTTEAWLSAGELLRRYGASPPPPE